MTDLSSKEVLLKLNNQVSSSSHTTLIVALSEAFADLLESSGSIITSLISSAKAGNWTPAKQEMQQIMNDPAFKTLKQSCLNNGLKSLAIIGGASGSFVVGGKGEVGLLIGLDDTTAGFFSYESIGVTAGAEEGGDTEVGLFVTNDSPKDVAGSQFSVNASVSLGVGLAAATWVSITGSWGIYILSDEGESLDISAGAGYAWVQAV